jgi:hypothetical protein
MFREDLVIRMWCDKKLRPGAVWRANNWAAIPEEAFPLHWRHASRIILKTKEGDQRDQLPNSGKKLGDLLGGGATRRNIATEGSERPVLTTEVSLQINHDDCSSSWLYLS